MLEKYNTTEMFSDQELQQIRRPKTSVLVRCQHNNMPYSLFLRIQDELDVLNLLEMSKKSISKRTQKFIDFESKKVL